MKTFTKADFLAAGYSLKLFGCKEFIFKRNEAGTAFIAVLNGGYSEAEMRNILADIHEANYFFNGIDSEGNLNPI
jgi:hypothetical protein